MKHWLITDKGCLDALALVDGYALSDLEPVPPGEEDAFHGVHMDAATGRLVGRRYRPHYSRQQWGTRLFTRNGQNLVFVNPDLRIVWVTFRPTPGVAVRPDGHDVWECALFRNEGPILSSVLIREAVELTCAIWGHPPQVRPIRRRVKVIRDGQLRVEDVETTTGGIITYIKPEAVLSRIPGYCYRRAGWRRVGEARDGKPMLRAPRITAPLPDWREWDFHGARGGKLRAQLCGGVR